MGKTSLALGFARFVGVEANLPVAVFSLEMSRHEVTQRLMCAEALVDSQNLRTGKMRQEDWGRLVAACDRLSRAPIYIDDTAGINVMEIRSKARRLKSQEKGLSLIIVDYLQLMQGATVSESRVQEISHISRSLKLLARDLDVPVMALSQLSRAVESRQDKRPILSDLRESGCVTGDTRVFLPESGTYERIDALVGREPFDVLAVSTDTWKLERATATRAFATGVKPVYRLRTRLGREVRATANHKFLTVSGWRRLDELSVGEQLALPASRPRELVVSAPRAISATHGGVATLNEAASGVVIDHDDIAWDAIASIEPAGTEPVYDLTVDELHNFVANDVIVHNSIEQDADVVMFIYRDEYYVKDSETNKGIAELIVAKHRSGATDAVELAFRQKYTLFSDLARGEA